MPSDCPFCSRIAAGDYTARQGGAVAFPDLFPLTPGHMLVAPVRHTPRLLSLSEEESDDLWILALSTARSLLGGEVRAFNLGVNDGPHAGQTVPHVHLHVIPRRAGDVEDPRGGVRWMIPRRAVYWGGFGAHSDPVPRSPGPPKLPGDAREDRDSRELGDHREGYDRS